MAYNVKEYQMMLYKLGYLTKQSDIDGVEGPTTANAIRGFQSRNGYTPNGLMSNETYTALKRLAGDIDEIIDAVATPTIEEYDDAQWSEDTKHDSFFTKNEELRNDNIDITIEFGAEKKVKKVLKNVFFRSVGTEVSPEGEAIYEVIEFIARDLEEK